MKKCELKSKPNKTKPSKGKDLRTNPFSFGFINSMVDKELYRIV